MLHPANRQVLSNIQTVQATYGRKTVPITLSGRITYDESGKTAISSRVSGRIERLALKYNYQPIKKGEVVMEVYSPQLVTAQRELLGLSRDKSQAALLQKVRQKLYYLGMTEHQINELLRAQEVSYRTRIFSPVSGYIVESGAIPPIAPLQATAMGNNGDNTGMQGMGASAAPVMGSAQMDRGNGRPEANAPVLLREGQYVSAGQSLFSIYTNKGLIAEFAYPQQLSPAIKKGKRLLFAQENDATTLHQGTVGLIVPRYTDNVNFSLFRVYLGANDFVVGQLLKATMALSTDAGWWLPQEAVLNLGSEFILFQKENGSFIPKRVNISLIANGMALINSDISGWQVASNAQYLIDSESFVMTALEN